MIYILEILFERLNAYQVMWLFVFFDLPVGTKKEIKEATRFRKNLEKDGFNMMQYSVYTRHCTSRGAVTTAHASYDKQRQPADVLRQQLESRGSVD